MSGHIGDMATWETLRAFERAVRPAQRNTRHSRCDWPPTCIRGTTPEAGRSATRAIDRWISSSTTTRTWCRCWPSTDASANPIVGVSFDGTGYGCDQTIWGGEILTLGTDSHRFVRAGHLLPVPLPGGDAAVRNPWRMALSQLWMADIDWTPDLAPVAAATPDELRLTRSQLESGTGCVPCSSMGRLFDAVASLLGVRHRIDYEGQAAIELEALAESAGQEPAGIAVSAAGGAGRRGDRSGPHGANDGVGACTPARHRRLLAAAFHQAVAVAVAKVVGQVAGAVRLVGLTGGVFQNVLLLRACRKQLQMTGFEVLTHHTVPPNDGGLALGQAAISMLIALEEG